ncbi:hypothetical protein A2U01_0080386, partial [Trifolium medium]|nr:hypothetical protein [Trifolium medium]
MLLMEGLCKSMNIQIDTPSSAIHSASSKAVDIHQTETKEAGTLKIKEIQQNNIKAVEFADSSE